MAWTVAKRIVISRDEYERLDVFAKRDGRTVSETCRVAVREALKGWHAQHDVGVPVAKFPVEEWYRLGLHRLLPLERILRHESGRRAVRVPVDLSAVPAVGRMAWEMHLSPRMFLVMAVAVWLDREERRAWVRDRAARVQVAGMAGRISDEVGRLLDVMREGEKSWLAITGDEDHLDKLAMGEARLFRLLADARDEAGRLRYTAERGGR